ncbi:hypothetical protein CKAH01_11923 [Colletotrichum kahawae]|uniref:Uncharacterized protein n=1 Tax=Colletotrichum kahawae TaxID=34407 RepID=A0AAE0DDF2_COLKA|nr:hypothetical protein CKAH01_11923 [Colletotrichum kahawae]
MAYQPYLLQPGVRRAVEFLFGLANTLCAVAALNDVDPVSLGEVIMIIISPVLSLVAASLEGVYEADGQVELRLRDADG